PLKPRQPALPNPATQKKRSVVVDAAAAEDADAKAQRPHRVFLHKPLLNQQQHHHTPRPRRNRGHPRKLDNNLPGPLRLERNLSNVLRLLPRRSPVPLKLLSRPERSKLRRCSHPSAPRTDVQAIRPWLRACRISNRCCAAWLLVRCIVSTQKKPPPAPAYSCSPIPIRSLHIMWKPARHSASVSETWLVVCVAALANPRAERAHHSIAA